MITAVQVIRADNYRRTRWKNGGGETAEIAVFPPGADINSFGWRISMAGIATHGPFSRFTGIDRTLAVLQGKGLRLEISGRDPLDLGTTSPPLSFPGDIDAFAHLRDGPVSDLNVMTRRAGFRHSVTRAVVDGRLALATDAIAALVFCHAGTAEISTGGERATLGPHDSWMAENPHGTSVECAIAGCALVYWIEIWLADQGSASR